MDDPEKQLVYQVVWDHLREAAPDLLPTLEAELAAAFEVLPERSHGDEGKHPGGLRFDFPTEAWTAVTAAIWISVNLVTEAVRHRKDRDRERALDRLETLLADQVANPVLVHELRGRLEEALARRGRLHRLLLGRGRPEGARASLRVLPVLPRRASPARRGVPESPPVAPRPLSRRPDEVGLYVVWASAGDHGFST